MPNHAYPGDADMPHLLSNDALLCATAPTLGAVAASLALRQAPPLGALFNASVAVPTDDCAALGYAVPSNDDDDPCLSAATTVSAYHRTVADRAAYRRTLSSALAAYASTNSLALPTVRLLLACACASPSTLAARCAPVVAQNYMGCWIHHDPYPFGSHPNSLVPDRRLMCDEGPFVVAVRSLATLKSSPQLAMHLGDQISVMHLGDQISVASPSTTPTSCCAALGFPYQYPPIDHCYPPMRIRTRTADIATDEGVNESVWLERNLTNGYNNTPDDGFVAFALGRLKIAPPTAALLNNYLGCNCLPESAVGKQMALECWSGNASADLPHSPVRDLWPSSSSHSAASGSSHSAALGPSAAWGSSARAAASQSSASAALGSATQLEAGSSRESRPRSSRETGSPILFSRAHRYLKRTELESRR